ncbi:hypothetical protein S245_035881, partial [Arachis hypogaea]
KLCRRDWKLPPRCLEAHWPSPLFEHSPSLSVSPLCFCHCPSSSLSFTSHDRSFTPPLEVDLKSHEPRSFLESSDCDFAIQIGRLLINYEVGLDHLFVLCIEENIGEPVHLHLVSLENVMIPDDTAFFCIGCAHGILLSIGWGVRSSIKLSQLLPTLKHNFLSLFLQRSEVGSDNGALKYTLFWIMLLLSKLAFSYYVE